MLREKVRKNVNNCKLRALAFQLDDRGSSEKLTKPETVSTFQQLVTSK